MKREIEGFEFHSYEPDLVGQILMKYLAGSSLKKLSLQLEGVSFAQAQRIIDEAVVRGVLLPEEKHPQGCSRKKIIKASAVLRRYPNAKLKVVARMAECAETTVWRAKAKMSE